MLKMIFITVSLYLGIVGGINATTEVPTENSIIEETVTHTTYTGTVRS